MPGRLFPGTVALTFPFPAIRFGGLDDLSFNAAPTVLFDLFTMPECFFSRSVTLSTFRPGLRLRKLNGLSIDAVPAKFLSTMAAGFLLGAVRLTTPRPTFRFR